MPKERAFRLKNLRVGEVSLVDRPAIEREFLVIKADTDPPEGEPNMPEEKKSPARWAIDALKFLALSGDGEDADEAAKTEAKKVADEKAAADLSCTSSRSFFTWASWAA